MSSLLNLIESGRNPAGILNSPGLQNPLAAARANQPDQAGSAIGTSGPGVPPPGANIPGVGAPPGVGLPGMQGGPAPRGPSGPPAPQPGPQPGPEGPGAPAMGPNVPGVGGLPSPGGLQELMGLFQSEEEPSVPEQEEEQLGVRDRLGRNITNIIAGKRPDGLADEEWEKIKNESYVQAGLSILMAGDPAQGGAGKTLGAAMALGVLQGRQHAAQSSGALLDERARQSHLRRYSQVFEENPDLGSRGTWEKIARIAAEAGNLEDVKMANDVLANMPEGEQAGWVLEEIDGMGQVWIDEDRQLRDVVTREPITQRPTRNPDPKLWMQVNGRVAHPETGEPVTAIWHPETGETIYHGLEDDDGMSQSDWLNHQRASQDQAIRLAAEARQQHMNAGSQEAATNIGRIRRLTAQYMDPETGEYIQRTEPVSSVETRTLVTAFGNLLQAGNMRESAMEAVLGSAGRVNNVLTSIYDVTDDGAMNPVVFNDLMKLIPHVEQAAIDASQEVTRQFQNDAAMIGIDPSLVVDPMRSLIHGGR